MLIEVKIHGMTGTVIWDPDDPSSEFPLTDDTPENRTRLEESLMGDEDDLGWILFDAGVSVRAYEAGSAATPRGAKEDGNDNLRD